METQEETPTSPNDTSMFTVGSAFVNPIRMEINIENKPLSMEVNTAAAVSIMSGDTFTTHFPNKHLSPSTAALRACTEESTKVFGEVDVSVCYEQQLAARAVTTRDH